MRPELDAAPARAPSFARSVTWGVLTLAGIAGVCSLLHTPWILAWWNGKIPLSLAQAVGLVLGFAVASRSRRLLVWSLGPLAGYLVGSLDELVSCWLFDLGEGSLPVWFVPVFGLVGGLAVGAQQPTGLRAAAACGGALLLEFLGRWIAAAYLVPPAPITGVPAPQTSLSWIAGWLALGPSAAVLVAWVRPPVIHPRESAGLGRRVCLGLAFIVAVSLCALWLLSRRALADVELPEHWRRQVNWHCKVENQDAATAIAHAFAAAGYDPEPQRSPPGRRFVNALQAYDPVHRVGFVLFEFDAWRDMRMSFLRAGDGGATEIRILGQPFAHADALTLVLCEGDRTLGDGGWALKAQSRTVLPSFVHWDSHTVDALQARSAIPARRLVAATTRAHALRFLDFVRRRREGESVGADPCTHLGPSPVPRLQEKYAPWRVRFAQAVHRARTSDLHPEACGSEWVPGTDRQRLLVMHPFRVDRNQVSFRPASRPTSTLPSQMGERFWINTDGDIIGAEDEFPPDGYEVVEWFVDGCDEPMHLVLSGKRVLVVYFGPRAGR